MNNKKYQIIAGIVLSLAGVVGSLTISGKYSLISLLGIVYLLMASQTNKKSSQTR